MNKESQRKWKMEIRKTKYETGKSLRKKKQT